MIRSYAITIAFSVVVTICASGCGPSPRTGDIETGADKEGAEYVDSHGYTGCVRIYNGTVSVILDPNCGGRVLEYSIDGRNVIYLNPAHDGWMPRESARSIDPSGGRCDIGPELLVPRHPELWTGQWKAEIIGPRAARLTSKEDPSTGVQLIRVFRLDSRGSHLRFTQTIKNVSTETKRYCHWSRTFVLGGGACLVPLSEWSKFPRGFIMYDTGSRLSYRMRNTGTVRVRDNFFEITGPPELPQYAIDSYAGWLGYITTDNLLMVKRFPTYMDRPYGDLAAFTVVIWYNRDEMCELEPIGPIETIQSGQSVSFTEDWWLFNYSHPGPEGQVDLAAFSDFVADNAR